MLRQAKVDLEYDKLAETGNISIFLVFGSFILWAICAIDEGPFNGNVY